FDVTWIAASEPTPKGEWVAIVPLLSRWVGGTEFKNLPKLRIVANCAVGYNNVDLVAAEMRKVLVTNTPGVLTEATADLTWALILATARRLREGVELVRSGQWTGWHPEQLLGLELRGRILGLLGAGRIGQAVGRHGPVRLHGGAGDPSSLAGGAAYGVVAAHRQRRGRDAAQDGGDRDRERAGGAEWQTPFDPRVQVGVSFSFEMPRPPKVEERT